MRFKQNSDGYWIPAENSGIMPDFDGMTDEELVKYAEEKNIDLSKAKTRSAIIKLLKK